MPKILYCTLIEQASFIYIYCNIIYKILKEKGFIRYYDKKRPKLNIGYAILRLKFIKKYYKFNWR